MHLKYEEQRDKRRNEGKKISINVIKLVKNKYLKGQISEILNRGTPTPPRAVACSLTVKMLINFNKMQSEKNVQILCNFGKKRKKVQCER